MTTTRYLTSTRRRFPVQSVLVTTALIIISVCCLLPVVWMLLIALRPAMGSIGTSSLLNFAEMTLANFATVSQTIPLGTNFFNSAFTTILGTISTLFFCSLAGFAFAKFNFPLRKTLFYIVIGTMLIPAEVGIVPLFSIMKDLGLVNSLWSLIIPKAATAIGIFYMTQYIKSVPDEIIESARVDGAGYFGIYWRMILPIITPGLAVWATLTVIARWNDFFWPLIFLRSADKYTLMVSISMLPVSEGLSTPWPVIMAGTTVAVLPIIALYLLFQRFQRGGLTAGAVKG